MTPVKQQQGQEHLDAANAWLSRAVSRVRQPVESRFKGIEEQTGIENARTVRAYQGLLVPVFGPAGGRNVCAKCLATKRLIRILGRLYSFGSNS